MKTLFTLLSRTDWQYDIEFFESLRSGDISSKQAEFVKSVRLASPNYGSGIGAAPSRRVVFSTVLPVAKYVEKAALQFKIKGTDYILELARFDEYTPISPRRRERTSTAAVSWGATLFNPQWDITLGFRNSPDSGAAQRFEMSAQHGGLAALFPSSKGPETETNTEGFQEFINIISRVSELLGPGQDWSARTAAKENMTRFLDTELGTLF